MSNRKIFLDCGGHKGGQIKLFKRSTHWEEGFEIFSFEPMPKFAARYQNKVVENETYFNKAVWIEDGTLDFYVGTAYGGKGCTVHKNKTSGNIDKENPITVESMNFSKWLMETFDKDDYIILSMDIEGAEYQVLEKMFEDGSIDYINEAFVEWHQEKIDYPLEDHKSLVKRLKESIKLVCFELRPEVIEAKRAAKAAKDKAKLNEQ
jgi:FkbM family methyltransferase